MRRVRLLLVAGSLAGCVGAGAPATVQATLDGVAALGYRCEAGIPDNVPSGLTQWRCSGTVSGSRATIDVDGNDAGVDGFTLAINGTDPAISRTEFRRFVTAVSPLSAQPGLAAALDSWTGAQDPTSVGGVRVNGECDPTQCVIFIRSVDGPNQPLRLPQSGFAPSETRLFSRVDAKPCSAGIYSMCGDLPSR